MTIAEESDELGEARDPSQGHRARREKRSHASASREEGADRGSSSASDLVDAVANHIIPRLLLAHRLDTPERVCPAEVRGPPTAEEIAYLVGIAVVQDTQAGMDKIESMLKDGLSVEVILLDWIAAAARVLGDEWMRDEKSFAEVTLGAGTLHRMLATLRHRLKPPLSHRGMVLLLAAPGEQHTLAIHVLGDLLLHAGWDAVVKPNLQEDELITMVMEEPVTMVGISVSCETKLGPLDRIVARVRKFSFNRDVAVMLGGSIDLSTFASEVGAIFCPSARTALTWLERHARVSL